MLRSYSSALGVIPVAALILACAPTLRGAVPFEPPHELTVGSAPLGIAVGDLDGDGKTDLVLGAYEDDRVVIYPNLSIPGALTFGVPAVVDTGIHPQGIAVRDLDGDGKDEVITADSGRAVNTGTVSILHNTSVPGTIALVRSLALMLNTAHRVVSVDFDGDGRPDIAATANSNGIVAVFRNSGPIGSLAFTPAGTLSGGSPLEPLAAADLDGDSRPEVVISVPAANMMRIFPNTSSAGSISFGPGLDFAMPVSPRGIAVADMNQDGKPDLVVASESGTVSALANVSGGPGNISFGPRLDVPARAGICEIAVSDLDGDGRPDVATASLPANLIVVLRNVSANGQIALAIDQELPAGPSPFVTVSSDIDGDGANDILVSNYGWLTSSVFRNAVPAVAPFLRFPLLVECGGAPCTAYTAEVSAVVDHAVPTGYNCNTTQTCDGVVLAFNREKGDQVANCPPPGYTNAEGTLFLNGVINYVGATCRTSVPGLTRKHFLNYDGHSGYDFPASGQFIVAAASGVLEVPVADVINNPGGSDPHATYNSLRIRHANGLDTWYLHALAGSECLAFHPAGAPPAPCKAGSPGRPHPGDSVAVSAGDVIAIVDSTGTQASASHLHFELRRGNKILDPYEQHLWQ